MNEGLHETAGMPNTVARALEDRHVLRAEYRINSRWYELQHDRLISAIRRPESPEASLDQARRALKEGRWDVARELADAAARMAEIDDTWVQAEVQAILGEVDAALGDVKSAERRYDEAIATFVLRQQFDKVAEVLTAKGTAPARPGRVRRGGGTAQERAHLGVGRRVRPARARGRRCGSRASRTRPSPASTARSSGPTSRTPTRWRCAGRSSPTWGGRGTRCAT